MNKRILRILEQSENERLRAIAKLALEEDISFLEAEKRIRTLTDKVEKSDEVQ